MMNYLIRHGTRGGALTALAAVGYATTQTTRPKFKEVARALSRAEMGPDPNDPMRCVYIGAVPAAATGFVSYRFAPDWTQVFFTVPDGDETLPGEFDSSRVIAPVDITTDYTLIPAGADPARYDRVFDQGFWVLIVTDAPDDRLVDPALFNQSIELDMSKSGTVQNMVTRKTIGNALLNSIKSYSPILGGTAPVFVEAPALP
jgi:hypothetical protein